VNDKQKRVLGQIEEYAKIISNLHKSPNSKVEIRYAGDLAKGIIERVDYIRKEESTGLTPSDIADMEAEVKGLKNELQESSAKVYSLETKCKVMQNAEVDRNEAFWEEKKHLYEDLDDFTVRCFKAEAQLANIKNNSEKPESQSYRTEDGCPTEKAVLQREWQTLKVRAEKAEKDNTDLRNFACQLCGKWEYEGACDGCRWRKGE